MENNKNLEKNLRHFVFVSEGINSQIDFHIFNYVMAQQWSRGSVLKTSKKVSGKTSKRFTFSPLLRL